MSSPDQALSSTTVVIGTLNRVRKGHTKRFVGAPPVSHEPVRRPARVAIMLALAHKIQQSIDRGVVQDRAEVARKLGLTRARVTQLLDLTLLAPDIQALILELQAADGVEPMSERTLRDAVHAEDWAKQCEGLPFREWRDREAGVLAAHSVRANVSSGARQSHPSRALGLKGPMSTLVHSNPLVGQSASVAHGRWHPSHAQKGEP
jgi:predicted XRE-type DNA-binding protein